MNWLAAIEENIDDFEAAEATLPVVLADDVGGGTSASSHGARSVAPVASASMVAEVAADALTPEQRMRMEGNRQAALAKKKATNLGPYQVR